MSHSEEENLTWVKSILAPRQLSTIEELVFCMSLRGDLYREISQATGYDTGYLKDVGSRLWLALSQKLDCEVNKKNLPLILARFNQNQPSNSQGLLETSLPALAPNLNPDLEKLDFPGSPLSFKSPLYIERPPIEFLGINTLSQPGSLIRIKAPQRMGKTSLIHHLLGVAQQDGMKTVLINIQQADPYMFDDLEAFLKWFCWSMSQQLNLPSPMEEYWFPGAGSKLSCTLYLQEYLLSQGEEPLVIAIDKVHHLFDYPNLANNFFSLLRSWYEQGRVNSRWQKLRLIISHSTELGLSLQTNQSPFNVGLPLNLPQLNPLQINDLAQRYQLKKSQIGSFTSLESLVQLIGGHPYLLQLAFYWLASGYLSMSQLLQEAATPQGIYREYLRQQELTLEKEPELKQSFEKVLASKQPILLDSNIAYRLEGLGLVKLEGFKASPQCELYRGYFNSPNA